MINVVNLSNNLGNLISILDDYDKKIGEAKACFQLEGEKLEDMCKKHAQDLYVYDSLLGELKVIENLMEMKASEAESIAYKFYNEKNGLKLSTSDLKMYVQSDQTYMDHKTLLFEVQRVRRQAEAVVEALKDLGWNLSHIVKIRVADLEDTIL